MSEVEKVMRFAAPLLLLTAAACMPGCLAMRFIPVGGGARGEASGEVVRFATTDGLMLEGRWYGPRHPGDHEAHREPDPLLSDAVVLHCHGVADNNTSAMASFLGDAGFRRFQFDYRGFGHSDAGRLSGRGFASDAIAALDHVRSREGVDPGKVIVYGHSMGGAYALAAAAEAEARGEPVRAVIVVNSFASWRRMGHYHLPVLGYVFGGVDGPPPTAHLSELERTPLLIVHTGDDEDVPPEESLALYRAALRAGVRTTLVIHPEGGHAWPFWGEPELERVIVDYARDRLAAPPEPRSAGDERLRRLTEAAIKKADEGGPKASPGAGANLPKD